MVSAPSRWRWVIGAAAVCAVYLVVRSIADLHTAFGGGSAVDYLAIASAGRVVHGGSSCVPRSLAAAQAQLLGYIPAWERHIPRAIRQPRPDGLADPAARRSATSDGDRHLHRLNVAAMALRRPILAKLASPRSAVHSRPAWW